MCTPFAFHHMFCFIVSDKDRGSVSYTKFYNQTINACKEIEKPIYGLTIEKAHLWLFILVGEWNGNKWPVWVCVRVSVQWGGISGHGGFGPAWLLQNPEPQLPKSHPGWLLPRWWLHPSDGLHCHLHCQVNHRYGQLDLRFDRTMQ